MDAREEFQLEQFRALRVEINNNITEIRTLQRYAVIGVALVWAWIATNPAAAPHWAVFAPLMFVVLGSYHTYLVLRDMRDQGTFIALTMEREWCEVRSGHSTGWETWIRETPPKLRSALSADGKPILNHNPIKLLAPVWVTWGFVFVAILIVGSLQWRHWTAPIEARPAACCCTK